MRQVLGCIITVLIMILSTGCQKNELPTETLPVTTEIGSTTALPISPLNVSTRTETVSSEMITTTASEEATTIEETTETTQLQTAPTTEIVTTAAYTFTDMGGVTMYATASVNLRSEPFIDGDIIGALDKNDTVYVTGQCNETGWYRIRLEGQILYVSDIYVSYNKVQETTEAMQTYIPATTAPATTTAVETRPQATGFVYYKVSTESPAYELEQYLYEQLVAVGIGWWYPYAVAQIFQESRWNPNSTNGSDHGICQFKGIYWEERSASYGLTQGDIWNPYHSLYVYSRYIRDVLASHNWDIRSSLAYYITGIPGMRHDEYVNHVLGWMEHLH